MATEDHLNRVDKFIERALDVKAMKSKDYNSGGINIEQYYVFGEETLVGEIWKKTLRLVSLYKSENEPRTDTIEDTLIDLICYSADLAAYREFLNDQKAQALGK